VFAQSAADAHLAMRSTEHQIDLSIIRVRLASALLTALERGFGKML